MLRIGQRVQHSDGRYGTIKVAHSRDYYGVTVYDYDVDFDGKIERHPWNVLSPR